MKNDLVEVTTKGVLPTANGCAVFLGDNNKCFVIYVDQFVGSVMQMAIDGVKKDRPLTHDLIGHILLGLGASIDRVVINDAREGTFFARLHLRMENELGKKLLEIDARPSDSIVLAIQHKRPVFVLRNILETTEDMTEVLERLLKQQEDSDDDLPLSFQGDSDNTEDDDDDDDLDEDDKDDDSDDEGKKR